MFHLTLTGLCAGQPYCNTDKAKGLEAGDTFGHMPYSTKGIAFTLNRPDLCPDCRNEWNNAGDAPKGV